MTKLSECSFEKKRFEESAKRSIEKLNLKKPEKLSKSFLIMTRITLHIDESKELVHLRVICYWQKDNNTKLQTYDLVAVQTRNEKILHALCIEARPVDILTFDYTQKMFKMKHSTLYEAGQKGIIFEMIYSQAILDSNNRRMIMSNLIYLSRTLRGKHTILSSGANSHIFHRTPSDIYSL